MRVRGKVERLCEYCKVVRQKKKIYVKCIANPRHKQRQRFSVFNDRLDVPLEFKEKSQNELQMNKKGFEEMIEEALKTTLGKNERL